MNLNRFIVVMMHGRIHKEMDDFFNEVDQEEPKACEYLRKWFVNQDFESGFPEAFFNLLTKQGVKRGTLTFNFQCYSMRCIFLWKLQKFRYFLRRLRSFKKRHDNLTLKGTKQHRFCINICQSKEEVTVNTFKRTSGNI